MRIEEVWDKGKMISSREIEEPGDREKAAKQVIHDRITHTMRELDALHEKPAKAQKDLETMLAVQTEILKDVIASLKIK